MELQPAFVRSFVETCYDAGVSVRATSDMLDAHIARDRCRNPEFQKGASEVLDVRALTDYVAGDDFWADTPPVPVMEKRSSPAKLIGAGAAGALGGGALGALAGSRHGFREGMDAGVETGARGVGDAWLDSIRKYQEGGLNMSQTDRSTSDGLQNLLRRLGDYAGSDRGQAQLIGGGSGAALGGTLGAMTGDEDSSTLGRSLIGALLGGTVGAGAGTLANNSGLGDKLRNYLNQ